MKVRDLIKEHGGVWLVYDGGPEDRSPFPSAAICTTSLRARVMRAHLRLREWGVYRVGIGSPKSLAKEPNSLYVFSLDELERPVMYSGEDPKKRFDSMCRENARKELLELLDTEIME